MGWILEKYWIRVSRSILALLLLFSWIPVSAESLILIQGYKAKGADWRDSGVVGELVEGGWVDGGEIGEGDTSLPSLPGPRVFTLELTTDAPLMYQLQQLEQRIALVRSQYSGESLILAGHSAGGVLGRLYMVRQPEAGVAALITISSPHLGTETAELGVVLGNSPLGWASTWLGEHDLLGRSQGLFFDLIRERPGSFLYWLNRQPHPQARYISVVRDESRSLIGDLVVPVWSQDMNQVYQLRGRAVTIPTGGTHGLDQDDGLLMADILRRLRTS